MVPLTGTLPSPSAFARMAGDFFVVHFANSFAGAGLVAESNETVALFFEDANLENCTKRRKCTAKQLCGRREMRR